MAKHRKMSEKTVRTRTFVGGILAGGALLAAGPAGSALADTTQAAADSTNPSANAVKRPDLGNPAPGVRATQAVGDRVFNQKTPVNKALDDSALGQVYHINFGTPDGGIDTSTGKAAPAGGANGVVKGELNVNAGKYYYDQAQSAGIPLPDEKDLPGALPKALSGNTSAVNKNAGPTSKTCTVGKTSVSAQAASC